MSDIILSDQQAIGVKAIKNWYLSLEFDDEGKLLEEIKQVFYVAGFAGVGKTAITKFAIAELGLKEQDVKYAAYTGKAALVMRRSGTPAQTIHSLIYTVFQASDEEIKAVEEKIKEIELELMKTNNGLGRIELQGRCEALKQELKSMKQPRFGVNPDSAASETKLIVLDECSMIHDDMAADILSFRKPVLVLGDPGQLPPIKGEGAFTRRAPDVFLTEIHRQAAESPIIRLATMARLGQPIPYGRHGDGDDVWKIYKNQTNPAMLLSATAEGGQVICGLNATRLDLNNHLRRAAGFDLHNPLPDEGSKIICLRNKNSIGLINGMFLELHGVKENPWKELAFDASIKTEDGDWAGGCDLEGRPRELQVYTGHFEDHVSYDRERSDRDWKNKRGLVEATYGWAITCHKAQGSAFDPTIIWDDHMSRHVQDRRKWLYTAISRAVSRLVILD